MSKEKLEYDDTLGGRETLPTHVSTYHYAAGALQEIKSLVSEAKLPANSKLIFQTLPKHMRRRAMSHHPKRLPRKHRAAHKSQMGKAGNQPVNSKRPSRKYRRRPKNLMREYVRRQRKHMWLETHIWHAKRFFMINRWGYRLPYASCNKTYRASYRATVKHCLLQDISYYSCLQLKGNLDLLKPGLARLTSTKCGLSFMAASFLKGGREGLVPLFADGQYPLGALQHVRFMWRPPDNPKELGGIRTLWLWLHPSAAEAIILQLISVFSLKSTKQQTCLLPIDEKDSALVSCTKTKAFERHRTYVNESNDVEMMLLQQEFNRFRLTGPQAQRVLAASLRTSSPNKYFESTLQLDSPSEVLSNLIFGVNVVDPRLQRPTRRTKAAQRQAELVCAAELLFSSPSNLPESDLWDPAVRERLGQQILTQYEYDQLRQQHAVVPGEPCAFEQDMQSVPLILIQRPGSQHYEYKRLGFGCGWDIIAPARYGMILWQTLIMWGARPGGLRELDSVARERGIDQHLPDTLVGRAQAAEDALERRTRYFRLPPNKRCNYRKLAVVSPFLPPWQQLVRDWQTAKASATPTGFFVLRDRELLDNLDRAVRGVKAMPKSLIPRCLIQVQLRLNSRGTLHDNALICLPTEADWRRRWRQRKHEQQAPVHMEPPQPDVNERLRKELRNNHKSLLKRLRGRRVREKRRLQETSTRRVIIRAAKTDSLVHEQMIEMCRLWLPTDPAETLNSVRRQCSREVFGYVSRAGFSFVEAKVCAVGYITSRGLRQLYENQRDYALGREWAEWSVLVRNADSRAYHFASLQINVNVVEESL